MIHKQQNHEDSNSNYDDTIEQNPNIFLSIDFNNSKKSNAFITEYFNVDSIKPKSISIKSNISEDFEEITNDSKNFIVFDNYSTIFSSEDWENFIKKSKNCSFTSDERNLIIASLEAGIPNDQRETIWKYLSKADNMALNHNKNFYHNLLKVKNKKIEAEIQKDIERTFYGWNKNDYEETYKPFLFNILKAYSVYDSEVGYAQGTNFIVLLLILNVKSQVDAFWLYVEIMIGKNWRSLFITNTPKLLTVLEAFVAKLSIALPEIYQHFIKENFIEQIPGTFTHYFTTLFSYNNERNFSVRIVDLFWVFEEEIIIDTLINIMEKKMKVLIGKSNDELHIYLKNCIVKECIIEMGVDNIIPKKKSKGRHLLEKEIAIN